MCYVATFQQSVAEKKRQLNSSSSVLTEKMPGQADDPWVFAPLSSGIGQRNFIQSLGSIGPMGGFKRIWCLGIFGWRKNGGIFDNFQGFFLFGIIVNIESWPKGCGFTVKSLPKKHHRCIPKACWNRWKSSRWLLLKQCVFHVSKGSSTLTEGFFKQSGDVRPEKNPQKCAVNLVWNFSSERP